MEIINKKESVPIIGTLFYRLKCDQPAKEIRETVTLNGSTCPNSKGIQRNGHIECYRYFCLNLMEKFVCHRSTIVAYYNNKSENGYKTSEKRCNRDLIIHTGYIQLLKFSFSDNSCSACQKFIRVNGIERVIIACKQERRQ
jgi:hypothetical protein